MKKLYTLLCLSLIGMASFVASAAKITLNIDDPSRITLSVNDEPYTGQLVPGDNEFDSFYISIEATEGNILEEVIWEGGYYDIPVEGNKASFSTFTSGAKYYIKTNTAEAYFSASVNVNVDDASAVRVTFDESKREVALNNGDNTIKYNPEKEKTLKIYSSVSAQVPLYKVTVGDATEGIDQKGNVYFITMPCEETINITSHFPDKECTVTFVFDEVSKDYVTKVTKDTSDGESVDISTGKAVVNAGTILYIHANTEDYLLDTYTVDGIEEDFSSPQRLIVRDADITVAFKVIKYKQFNVTVNVNNPSALEARYGSTLYPGDIIELNEGDNTVVMNENRNSLLFAPADNVKYKIASATKNGEPVEPNYSGKVQIPDLAENDKIVITMAEIMRDTHAVIYLNNAGANMWDLEDASGNTIELATGYNHIYICSDDNPFSLSGGYGTPYVYANDEAISATGSLFSKSYKFNLSEGSVAKIFVGVYSEPSYYTLTFSEEGFDAVDVIADEIRPVASRLGFETLEGTKIEITPRAGKNVSVAVDGEPVEAADGKYTFSVSAAHNIDITSGGSSGIDNIDCETPARNVIYNLQGVRIDASDIDALPAGLYIVNGVKTLVK